MLMGDSIAILSHSVLVSNEHSLLFNKPFKTSASDDS